MLFRSQHSSLSDTTRLIGDVVEMAIELISFKKVIDLVHSLIHFAIIVAETDPKLREAALGRLISSTSTSIF